jgi:Zn-dependent M28 family amino/carboxypeptidase
MVFVALIFGMALVSYRIYEPQQIEQGTLKSPANTQFDAERALADVEYQVMLGARTPGSQAHYQAVDWMETELQNAGWRVEIQESYEMGHLIRNVIARLGDGRPWVILGAHYDSRFVADQDPDPNRRSEAVLGANDGASGVAVLLEVARVLPNLFEEHSKNSSTKDPQVWIVFFDAEDQGNYPGWEWILGSRAFVKSLREDNYPDAAVIVDMIGDADLDIYMERNSHPELTRQLWSLAKDLGYGSEFIPKYRHQILDDHIPFIEAGIPAIDIIDFDYPHWHTTHDTLDKVSARSLQVVGEVLLNWLGRITEFTNYR